MILIKKLLPSRSSSSFCLLLHVFLHRLIRVLDGETPDVQVVTDSPDNIHDEAPVYTYAESQAHKDESNLVDIVT
jgi:hypothetical protein